MYSLILIESLVIVRILYSFFLIGSLVMMTAEFHILSHVLEVPVREDTCPGSPACEIGWLSLFLAAFISQYYCQVPIRL